MEKQTAVEWLVDQITLKKLGDNSLFLNPIIIGDLVQQAKELEKQQIINAYEDGQRSPYEYSNDNEVNYYDGENYYKTNHETND